MTKQTSLVMKITVFVVVMLTVLSISFLVEARDLPATQGAAVVVTKTSVPSVQPMDLVDVADGLASWYGRPFHGRRTASGRKYDMHELTAAHKNLPFGSLVRVVNAKTQQRILVEITDRGPFIRKRVIDLSYAAARALGVSVTPVELQALRPADVAAHYAGDSTTLLVIDGDYTIHRAAADAVEQLSEPMSFTKAHASLGPDSVILIVPAEGSRGLTYATARLRVPVNGLDTVDVAVVQ